MAHRHLLRVRSRLRFGVRRFLRRFWILLLPKSGSGSGDDAKRLIDVRPHQFECVLDQFAARFRLTTQNDLDHIESINNLRIIQHPQPGLRSAINLPFLKCLDVLKRPAQIFVGSRFYLHENQRLALATHDIDFAAGAMFEIPVENLVTAFTQKPAGCFLPLPAPDMLRPAGQLLRGREAVAPPARKTGDGSGKDRADGAS